MSSDLIFNTVDNSETESSTGFIILSSTEAHVSSKSASADSVFAIIEIWTAHWFRMTYGWTNTDRFLILGWTLPLAPI